MATSKRNTPAKKAPSKTEGAKPRPPRKRPVKKVTLREWTAAKKGYLIIGAVVLVVMFVVWNNYQARYADRAVNKGIKKEQKLQPEIDRIKQLEAEMEELKKQVDQNQEQAVKDADEATQDRVQFEQQRNKKKVETKTKYNETNQQVKDAAANYDILKLDAILEQQRRARQKVSDGDRIRATDTGFSRRYKGN